MSLFNIFNVAGSALAAQSVRLNTISSNLANADAVSSDPESVYRARFPVFATVYGDFMGEEGAASVVVEGVVQSQQAARKEYAPEHPLSDEEGYIYRSSVNSVEEMANMISASRSYQSSIEAMNTTKQLILRTINLGR